MFVLSAVTILAAAIVEFAFDTNVAYNLASNELDRLKATYLAQSAVRFTQLELKFDRVFRDVVAQQNLGAVLGESAQLPICQQFPLSTALIRALFLGGEPVEDMTEEASKMVTMSEEQGASEFLSFEGDFDAKCTDETTKVNLNAFADMDPEQRVESGTNAYTQYKEFLTHFLENPQFEALFEIADVKVEDAAQNIADWVDANTQIDAGQGRTGGLESSLYEGEGLAYRVKDDRLTTPLEVYQIVGVNDDWFGPLADRFTIYGDGRVNACAAPRDVIEALIRRFVESTPGLPPMRLGDSEVMNRLVAAISEGCVSGATGDALIQAVSQRFAAAILIGEEEGEGEGGGGNVAGNFANLITATSRFYTIEATGQVDETTVRITAVIDVGETDPKRWPLLYWRVF